MPALDPYSLEALDFRKAPEVSSRYPAVMRNRGSSDYQIVRTHLAAGTVQLSRDRRVDSRDGQIKGQYSHLLEYRIEVGVAAISLSTCLSPMQAV